MKANDWQVICRVEDIPVLGARRVARERGMDVAVFRNDADQVTLLVKAGEGTRFVIAARDNPTACNGGEPFEPVRLELEYCSEEP